MDRQVGPLQLSPNDIATKGLIIRLLILPDGLSGTQKTLRTIADELGTHHTLSIMGQYYPAGEAAKYPELQRGITQAEYDVVVDSALQLGFSHIYTQELSCSDAWTPRFVSNPALVESNVIPNYSAAEY
jgi:putative pyruvate formate lyase activating enzyme